MAVGGGCENRRAGRCLAAVQSARDRGARRSGRHAAHLQTAREAGQGRIHPGKTGPTACLLLNQEQIQGPKNTSIA